MLGQRADDAGAHVRRRADIKHDATVGQFSQQARILDRPDAVPDPVRTHDVDRGPDRVWTLAFARVRHRAETAVLGPGVDRAERLGRGRVFRAAEADAHDTAMGVRQCVRHRQLGGLDRIAARNVGGQRDPDAVRLPGFLGTVAVAGEHLLPRTAARDGFSRAEDALRGRPRRARPPGRRSRLRPRGSPARCAGTPWSASTLQEVRKVPELIEPRHLLDGIGRQREAVAPGDLEHCGRPGPSPPDGCATRSSGSSRGTSWLAPSICSPAAAGTRLTTRLGRISPALRNALVTVRHHLRVCETDSAQAASEQHDSFPLWRQRSPSDSARVAAPPHHRQPYRRPSRMPLRNLLILIVSCAGTGLFVAACSSSRRPNVPRAPRLPE